MTEYFPPDDELACLIERLVTEHPEINVGALSYIIAEQVHILLGRRLDARLLGQVTL